MANKLDVQLVLDNDINIQFNVVDINDNPIDITGYTILWQVKKSYKSIASISKTTADSSIVMVDSTAGSFLVKIAAADTANMTPGSYYHEALLIDTDSKQVTLTDMELAVGVFYLREVYTLSS